MSLISRSPLLEYRAVKSETLKVVFNVKVITYSQIFHVLSFDKWHTYLDSWRSPYMFVVEQRCESRTTLGLISLRFEKQPK